MARILIVDDSPTEVKKISTILEKHKHEVLTADNGADGVAKARAVIEAEAPRKLPIIPMTEGVVDPRVVLGLNAAAEDDLEARPSHHDGHHDHEHDDHGVEIPDAEDVRGDFI